MKIANMLKSIITSLYESLKRFPAAIVLSASAVILLMVLNHNNQYFTGDTEELIVRIVMTLALGIPLTLCTRLIFERKGDMGLFRQIVVYLAEALGLALYFTFFLKDMSMASVTRYIGINLSLYLAFVFIPYFYGRDDFELYVIKLLTRFFVTVIYSVVLFLGMVAILFTIDKLLEIRVDEKLYLDMWLGVVGIFAVSFFLAGVPSYKEQFELHDYPKLLKVLLLYIVMPIVSVYTAILYAYFAKIIITLQWPVGLVAHLVLWYSVICAVIIFLISPLREDNKWTRTFIFLLPKLILPLIIMMFFSIGIRVKAYGITENRYYVIALGLWALGVMIYSNRKGERKNIILLVSLSLIAFLSVVGPWSSYPISRFSQNQRLEGILMRNGMLSGGSIVKTDKAVSKVDKKEISQILGYFSNNHTLDAVKYLPEGFKMSQMDDVFGFPNAEYSSDNNRHYFSYNSDMRNNPVDIEGYSYMLPMDNHRASWKISDYDIEIKYDDNTQEIKISTSGRQIYNKSLQGFVEQLHRKHIEDRKTDAATDEMTLIDEKENIRVKLIFNHINGFEDFEGIKVNSMEFFLLIHLK